MAKFSFALIFSLYVFNGIFQGNAVETTPATESSNVEQKSDNIRDSNKEVIPEGEKRKDLSDERNAAFTVIQEFDSKYEKSYEYILPSISKTIEGYRKLSSIDSETTEEIHLCPYVSMKQSSKVLEAAYKRSPATQNCLFTTKFEPDEPKICAKEPKPWLVEQPNPQPDPFDRKSLRTNCNQNRQQLLAFVYLNCNTRPHFLSFGTNALISQRDNKTVDPYEFKDTYPMYEICYDFNTHKTLWTRHEVKEPMLMYDPSIPSKNIEGVNLATIDTSTFGFDSWLQDTFTKLKTSYQSKEANMKAEFLVPMRHFALQNWKKSTEHMMNTAPLQKKFHKLMNVINQGLIKAAYHTFIHTGVHLQIFTTAQTIVNRKNQFSYNAWYKFIYNEITQTGILIYLHNELDAPVAVEPCESDFHCHFNAWVKPEADIPNDILKHAGCCGVNSKRIKDLFNIDVTIAQLLGIHQMILSADITDTTLRFRKDQNASVAESSQQSNDIESNKNEDPSDDSKQEELLNETIDAGDENVDRDSPVQPNPSSANIENQTNDFDEKKSNFSDEAEAEKKESHDPDENKDEKIPEHDENNQPKKE